MKNKRASRGLVLVPTEATGRSSDPPSPMSSPKYLSLFAYPWDILDEGPGPFARLAQAAGLTNVSVASSYHGGKALLPHNTRHRVYLIEEGAIYFKPSSRFFGNVKMRPRVSRLAAKRDIWRDIVEACQKREIGTTAWTVSLHNTHLGTTYPEYTTQNAFGDRYPHALCPSQPDVMAYMRALVGNLAIYPIEAVEFECFEFSSFRHYAFLEKEGIGLTTFAAHLLSLCFCRACLLATKQRGVNGQAVANGVKAWLERYFEGGNRDPGTIESKIKSISGMTDYLMVRFDVLANCFSEVAELLRAENKKAILISIGQEQQLDYVTGIDLRRFQPHLAAIEILFYNRKPAEAAEVVRKTRTAIGSDTRIYFAVRPGYPDANNAQDVVRVTRSALRAGVSGISYYNFGLIEKFHLDWIGEAISTVSASNVRLSLSKTRKMGEVRAGASDCVAANVFRPVL